jgi:type IV pilus assembly protein PilB
MSSAATPTILCVDDNSDWLVLVKRWLTDHGYQAITASRCSEALEIVGARKPDLILLDVLMPEMDGYELCAQLQFSTGFATAPVLFLTAQNSEQDKAKALAVGGVGYLVKPVTEEELCAAIQRQLRTQEQWTALRGDRPAAGDVRGFLDFLLNQQRVPPAERARFKALPADKVYSLAAELSLSQRQIAEYLAAYTGHAYTANFNPQYVALGILPAAYCRTRSVIPLAENGQRCFVLSNPLDWQLLDDLKGLVPPGQPLHYTVTEPENIGVLFRASAPAAEAPAPKSDQLIKSKPAAKPTSMNMSMADIEVELGKVYRPEEEAIVITESSEESAPIIMLVNKIIAEACEMRASDIHIEPWEREVVVRYRIDGDLRIVKRFRPQNLILPLVARIKIMSQLVITERRLPQDGRIAFKEQIDLRVATSPMHFGEKVVLRILDKRRAGLPLSKLGFSARHLQLYREKIQTPYGMILHVGPTGSGKSMSLFAALKEIQRPELNIQTIEDPIEYTLPGINQMQTHAEIGLTFQRALRSYLRQDPDVILVGEIRDRETADAAVEAALTGHLLFSTLHTNDAASTVIRFIEMGIQPYLISPSIVMICAQRLLRCLCSTCKRAYDASAEEKRLAGVPAGDDLRLYRAKGCLACGGTGYRDRTGTHELLVLDDALRAALATRGSTADGLKRLAVETAGMTTLYWDAMEKMRQGITSIDEVLANVRADDFDSRPQWMRQSTEAALDQFAKSSVQLCSATAQTIAR